MDGCLVARSEPTSFADNIPENPHLYSTPLSLVRTTGTEQINDVINTILQYKDIYKAPQQTYKSVVKSEPHSPLISPTPDSTTPKHKSPPLEALQALLPDKFVDQGEILRTDTNSLSADSTQGINNGVKIFQTKQGYTLLICNGYRYSKISTSSNGKKIYWRCTLRSCKGKVHTDVGGGVVYESTHDHPPMAEEFLFSCHSNRLAKEARQIMRFDPLKCIKDEAPYSALESTPTFCKIRDRLNFKKSPEYNNNNMSPTTPTLPKPIAEEPNSPAIHTVHLSQSTSPGSLLRLPPLREGSLHITSPTNVLLTELNALRLTHHLCDVALCVGGSVIYAHRVVLAAASQYFRLLFLSNPKILSYIELRGVDAESVESLVSFAYTGCLTSNYTRVSELLTAANILHFVPVIERCCEYLRTQLTNQNCVRVREFAAIQGLTSLQNIVDKYIFSQWSHIIEHDDIYEARLETLLHFLGSDDLCVKDEAEVYKIIIKWVRRYPIYRQFYVGELLGKVRLVQLNAQFLLDTVEREEMIRQHRECESLLHKAKNHFLLPERHHGLEDYHFRKRKRKKNVCLLGRESGHTVVYEYDVTIKSATELTSKDTEICKYCSVNCTDKLYILGGRNSEGVCSSEVLSFNLSTRNWSVTAPMNVARSQHSAIACSNCIYVFGGVKNGETLASVECYSTDTRSWMELPALQTARSLAGLCVVGENIYVIGGRGDDSDIGECAVYNTTLKVWKSIAPLPLPLSGSAVTLGCDGKVYVYGSTDQFRYDLVQDHWETLSSDDTSSELLQACDANDDIFAMRRRGGKLYLDCLDNVTTRWQPCCAVDLPFTVEAMCSRTLG